MPGASHRRQPREPYSSARNPAPAISASTLLAASPIGVGAPPAFASSRYARSLSRAGRWQWLRMMPPFVGAQTPPAEGRPMQKGHDDGTAYELSPPRHSPELTEVGRGTPMGELLRRYWHPVGLSSDAGATPKRVQALGEEMILFRDGGDSS